jgi:thiol-disulfide isomerase/thioredoxin
MAKSTKRQGDMRSLNLLITAFVLATLVSCSDSRQLFGGDNWTVINYWAVWCKPCREEIPELNHLNGVMGIEVLGVNFDRKSGEALYADAQSLGLEFENIGDPSHQLGIERPIVLPTTVVLSPSGDVEAVLIGPQTKETILAVIRPDKD